MTTDVSVPFLTVSAMGTDGKYLGLTVMLKGWEIAAGAFDGSVSAGGKRHAGNTDVLLTWLEYAPNAVLGAVTALLREAFDGDGYAEHRSDICSACVSTVYRPMGHLQSLELGS